MVKRVNVAAMTETRKLLTIDGACVGDIINMSKMTIKMSVIIAALSFSVIFISRCFEVSCKAL